MARSSDRVAQLESGDMNAAETERSSEGHMTRGNVEGAKDRSDAERLLARGNLRRVNALRERTRVGHHLRMRVARDWKRSESCLAVSATSHNEQRAKTVEVARNHKDGTGE